MTENLNDSDLTNINPSIGPDQAVDTDLSKDRDEADKIFQEVHDWWDSLIPDNLGHDPKDFYKYFGLSADTLDTNLSFANLIKVAVIKAEPDMMVPEVHSEYLERRLRRIVLGNSENAPTFTEAFELRQLPENVEFHHVWENERWNCTLVSKIKDPSVSNEGLRWDQK